SKADGADGLKGLYEVSINGKVQLMTKEQLENTHFNLQGGHDTLVVAENVDANIHADGGDGDDVMLGGAGKDSLDGGTGKDIVMGRGGRDWLDGGKDHDRDIIEGGADDDIVVARSEDRVVTDRETGVSGQDLVVDGDVQDRMEETLRNLR
ncbi:MAG TPA: hypothetical protein VLJ62_06415, partial [Burkholderiaceae bacterium]|nr:hypothetical protein [Burkholderiaceae bacterium]